MKILIALVAPVVMAGAFFFALSGYPHFNYMYCGVFDSARGFWIDYREGGQGWLRRGWLERWPLEESYSGATCTLRVLRPPGIGRSFLTFETPEGTSTTLNLLWEIRPDGALRHVARIITMAELTDEHPCPDNFFRDVDGDGIEELLAGRRDEVVWHRWCGDRFVPRYRQEPEGPQVRLP